MSKCTAENGAVGSARCAPVMHQSALISWLPGLSCPGIENPKLRRRKVLVLQRLTALGDRAKVPRTVKSACSDSLEWPTHEPSSCTSHSTLRSEEHTSE